MIVIYRKLFKNYAIIVTKIAKISQKNGCKI